MNKQTAERLETAIENIRDHCSGKNTCVECAFLDTKGEKTCKFQNHVPENWEYGERWVNANVQQEPVAVSKQEASTGGHKAMDFDFAMETMDKLIDTMRQAGTEWSDGMVTGLCTARALMASTR